MPNVSEKSDQSLLDDFVRRGDESAFAELTRRHQAMALSVAYRISGDREEARDILQQALIVLARRARELGDVRCLCSWLHRVVVLEAKKARRKTTGRRVRESMAYQMNGLSPEEQDYSKKIIPELDRSMDALREKDREVLTLHFLEGHTFKSIERQLGGTAEAWQKRSVRALEKLAEKLRSRGVTVSTMVVGAYFVSARAKAGVTASFLETITRRALDEGAKTTAGTLGKSALLLTMKTGIAISLTSGVLLAYGLGIVTRDTSISTPLADTMNWTEPEPQTELSLRDKRDRGFTLELVKQAVSDYDGAKNADSLAESRLRSLMFLVPTIYLEEVFQVLVATKDHLRFQQVVGALFGSWAERDPTAALARAKEAGDFSYQARRAVMVTWLNQDPEGALAVMLPNKSKDELEFLTEYVTYQCERKPHEAAVLVDRIAKDWPEADRPLFEMVAKLWSRIDALAAGDWVASYPDLVVQQTLLKSIAVDVAKIRGFDGLAIANHIEDEKAREEARNEAIYWWATTTGGVSLIPGQAKPVRDISGGFPADWTSENIRTFSFATMINYTKNLPDLLRIAKDDGQRILIYEGAVKGSGWSNPAAVSEAAEQLPDSFADTSEGMETLKVFIRRWSEMDGKAAEYWLSKQSPGPKTEVMRTELKGKNLE